MLIIGFRSWCAEYHGRKAQVMLGSHPDSCAASPCRKVARAPLDDKASAGARWATFTPEHVLESNSHTPRMVARRVALASALLVALANRPLTVLAQGTPPAPPPADLLQRVRALGLPSSTDRLTVYFNRGHEAKAVRIRTLVQEARQFFADSLGLSPELAIAVLERSTWDRLITWQPYGIPGVQGTPPVAFLPATDDNLAANDALSLEAAISDTARRLITASGRTWTEASKRYVDLVGLHELGHAFAAAYGIDVPSKWFNEWLATYFSTRTCVRYARRTPSSGKAFCRAIATRLTPNTAPSKRSSGCTSVSARKTMCGIRPAFSSRSSACTTHWASNSCGD